MHYQNNIECIIFKASKYNYDNTMIVEALSHRFSDPTTKEYICKACDKDLQQEIMPMNSVASWIQLTSNDHNRNVSTVIHYVQRNS